MAQGVKFTIQGLTPIVSWAGLTKNGGLDKFRPSSVMTGKTKMRAIHSNLNWQALPCDTPAV